MRKWMILALLALPVHARAVDGAAPDFAAMRAAGQTTVQKLRTSPAAAWKVTVVTTTNVNMTADVLEGRGVRRIAFLVKLPNAPAPVELCRLIETPTAWYYAETEGARRKHRPHEVELPMTAFGVLRASAELRFITSGDAAALGRFVGRDGDVARYSAPWPNAPMLRALLTQMDDMAKADPAGAGKSAEFQKSYGDIRRRLEGGMPLGIDARTGIVAEYVMANAPYKVTDFRLLDAVPAGELEPEKQKWEDLSDDPTVSAPPEDLMMLGHAPIWRPGMPSHETDAVLLDLRSGHLRRVPFQGAVAVPGCFLKDRSGVIVGGADVANGAGIHLYQIDLKTGANRRLGGDALAEGVTLMPALSPDGKSVAALHKAQQGALLATQVVVVDLATNAVRKVGPPVDGAYLNWLPDGNGFVLLMGKDLDPRTKETRAIWRMGMDGELAKLCEGRGPVVLAGRKAIAFQADDFSWKLCDFDGGNPRPLAGGDGAHLMFATASPDDNRLAMIAYVGKEPPAPIVFDLATQTQTRIRLPAGLWTTPAWR